MVIVQIVEIVMVMVPFMVATSIMVMGTIRGMVPVMEWKHMIFKTNSFSDAKCWSRPWSGTWSRSWSQSWSWSMSMSMSWSGSGCWSDPYDFENK